MFDITGTNRHLTHDSGKGHSRSIKIKKKTELIAGNLNPLDDLMNGYAKAFCIG